jgi:hypothetical protein
MTFMKKTLIICALSLAASLSSFAQSSVTFANDGSTLIRQPGSTSGVAVGAYRVEMLYAPVSVADAEFTTMAIRLGSDVGISPAAGRFNGGGRTAPTTTAGSAGKYMIRAWSGAVGSSYDSVVQSGSGFVGKSGVMTITGGNPTTTPAGTPTPIVGNGFTGFEVSPVPEPSAIALGLLGAGTLLLLRRRK